MDTNKVNQMESTVLKTKQKVPVWPFLVSHVYEVDDTAKKVKGYKPEVLTKSQWLAKQPEGLL